MDLAEYDDLLGTIYSAGAGTARLSDMFAGISRLMGATAGVSMYDRRDLVITHTLFRSARSLSRRDMEQIRLLSADSVARLFTVPNFPLARRYTDVIPEQRLRNAPWFKRQAELTGTGHVLSVDIRIQDLRVRLFVVRKTGANNFNGAASETLERLARHLERAFATSLQRFSPYEQADEIVTLLFDEDQLAALFVRRNNLDGLLMRRFALSAAETRVLKVMIAGPTRADAAAILGIGCNSLKTHMRRIYAKTDTGRLPELILKIHALSISP